MKACRIDKNQNEIVKGLRKIGASVFITSTVGKGFVGIVCGFRGINYLFEIKDGSKPPSRQKLTNDEQEFFNSWNGKVYIVKSLNEAISILNT